MLISNSTFSQYPQVKKIGKDSIVLITLKQGNEINKQFSLLKDTLNTLRASSSKLEAELDYYRKLSYLKWQKENSAHSYEFYKAKTLELKIDSLKAVNEKNKIEYEKYTKESIIAIRHITVFATILGFLTVVFAAL